MDRRNVMKYMASVGFLAQTGCFDNSEKGVASICDSVEKDIKSLQALKIPTWYYQHFDADHSREVPEQAMGGWKQATLEFPKERTALVIMHAWDTGSQDQYPGWKRAAGWIKRAGSILENVFPPLLTAARESGMNVFHVAGGSNKYWEAYPGYKYTETLALPENPNLPRMKSDQMTDKLMRFRAENVFVGKHNEGDVADGFANMDFAKQAKPLDNEPIAADAGQLAAICREKGVNHLIYCGFAINWCLLLSPGGMADMSKYGIICSAMKDAVCAVENRETAAEETAKGLALWRVSLAYGFVFESTDFIKAIAEKAEI